MSAKPHDNNREITLPGDKFDARPHEFSILRMPLSVRQR
jgi:hypothetical protein